MANEVNGNDKVERINRGDRTSENTASDGVIGGDRKEHQEIHQEASKEGQTFTTFSDNNDDQSFKAIQPAADTFGIVFDDGVETSKGKVAKPHTQDFFESKAQGAMTAINEQPKIQSDQLIAANLKSASETMSDGTYTDGSQTNEIPDGTKIADYPGVKPPIDKYKYPLRLRMDEHILECTKDNPKAWEHAYQLFPKLHEYLTKEQTVKLMKALMRNELYHYDLEDEDQDESAKSGNPEWDRSLGYTQITPRGVQEFETGIMRGTKVREPYEQLKRFLTSQGHSGEGHETRALEDPICLPAIMAAKLTTLIELYEKHNQHHPDSPVAINSDTLAYGYNADVYKNPKGEPNYRAITDKPSQILAERVWGLKKAFPPTNTEILKSSTHLDNVKKHLKHYSDN